MRYIFELNHPKHYYQFKYVMQILRDHGHEIKVLARDKDVLLRLLQEEGVKYEIFGLHKKTLKDKIIATPKLIWNYLLIARHFHPDVIVSKASFYGCFVAKMIGAKSVIFPDSEVVKVTNKYVVPLATMVVTPKCFALNYGTKHRRIEGIFEDCYLAPDIINQKIENASESVRHLVKPYAVLRFVGWFANHDVKNEGLTLDEKKQIIAAIEPPMTVYISSEKDLPQELKKYQLPTPANEIHAVLAGADLYIGDSQTMAAEAALLGAPAIRTNTFVGPNDMTNFKMLENKGLLRNIRKFDDVLSAAKEMVAISQKNVWMQRKKDYFDISGNANHQIAEWLENIY